MRELNRLDPYAVAELEGGSPTNGPEVWVSTIALVSPCARAPRQLAIAEADMTTIHTFMPR
jgi:hypothetical protein